jgi:hypothetical protein
MCRCLVSRYLYCFSLHTFELLCAGLKPWRYTFAYSTLLPHRCTTKLKDAADLPLRNFLFPNTQLLVSHTLLPHRSLGQSNPPT